MRVRERERWLAGLRAGTGKGQKMGQLEVSYGESRELGCPEV